MIVIDSMFDDFFSKRISHEGFEIDPTHHFGLIAPRMSSVPGLQGYAITMDGAVVIQELNPTPSSAVASNENHEVECINC